MILDINLPDGDGFALFRQLRARADIPALFLSAGMPTPTVCSGWGWGQTIISPNRF